MKCLQKMDRLAVLPAPKINKKQSTFIFSTTKKIYRKLN